MDSLMQAIPFFFPGVPNVGCLFTGSMFGNISLDLGLTPDSAAKLKLAVKKREQLLCLSGAESWTELKQVHQDTLLDDPPPTDLAQASTLQADGACTARPGQALVIKTADCQPILLTHKGGQYIAALHAGWRGNAINFVGSGVKHFCARYALEAKDVLAVRGPSLGPGAAEFKNFAAEWPGHFRTWFDESSMRMDLWALTRQQLLDAGLQAGHIYSLDLCTWSLPMAFFSHRRGHEGRQASLVYIKG